MSLAQHTTTIVVRVANPRTAIVVVVVVFVMQEPMTGPPDGWPNLVYPASWPVLQYLDRLTKITPPLAYNYLHHGI